MPVRSISALITMEPRSPAGIEASDPRYFPTAVRIGAMIAALRMKFLFPGLALLLGVADHLTGDDQLLNLRCTLVDAKNSDVAIETLYLIFCHVSGAAVDLDHSVRDAPERFRSKVFECGAFQGHCLAGVEFRRNGIDKRLRRQLVDLRIPK